MEKIGRLSKRPDWKVEIKKDNENQTLSSLTEVVIEELEVDIVEKIKIVRRKNEEVVKVEENIKKVGFKILKENEQQIEGDLMLKERKVYILKDKELRVEIIQLHHDMLAAGYRRR